MTLPAVFTSTLCLGHDTGPGHVESPARLRAVRTRIAAQDASALRQAEPAPHSAIERVHPRHYLNELVAFAEGGGGAIGEPDMIVSRRSFVAAQAAAGAALAAVRHACEGKGNAFAAVRPPGHHALAERPMGFCLLANAVIAAREAQALGRERVFIVDWDVHHGNGTQALIEHDPSVRFVSMHQWPHYPGTGRAEERGVGNVFNVPLPAGLPHERYTTELRKAIRLALTGWDPHLILISAGYDSMLGDPLGGFTLEPVHYARLCDLLRSECPNAPIVGLLEGGYAPELVADGVMATLEALV